MMTTTTPPTNKVVELVFIQICIFNRRLLLLTYSDWVDGVSLSRLRHYHKVNTKAGDEFYLKYLQLLTCLRRGMNSITPTTIVSIDRLVLNNNINIMQLCRYVYFGSFDDLRSPSIFMESDKQNPYFKWISGEYVKNQITMQWLWNGIY